MKKLEAQAKTLAERPYTLEIIKDRTSDGTPIYLVRNPELPGCMAQGATIPEAEENLFEARIEFIESLLREGLEVPDPIVTATQTWASASFTHFQIVGVLDEPAFIRDLSQVVEPQHREQVAQVSLRT